MPVVYDLGQLGIGEKYVVEDESFQKRGYYSKESLKGYKSKSLFKPDIVQACVEKYDDLVAYLDGDALLCDSIDEIDTEDYDVGVTLRKKEETESEWNQKHFEVVKYVNAGVIFFRPTQTTKDFIKIWKTTTENVGNDQMALNQLTCPNFYPEPYSIHVINRVRVKFFPCEKYNFYYFNSGYKENIKIMHFKGPVRRYYPFNWKKKLYCQTIIPITNVLSKLKKLIC